MSHKIKARHAWCPLWWTQAPKLLNRSSPHLPLQAPSGLLHIHPAGSGPWGKWKCPSLSCVWLFVTTWTAACQAPLSMEISRQEYWSGLSFPPPGDLPDPGIESRSSALQVGALLLSHEGSPHKCWLPCNSYYSESFSSDPGISSLLTRFMKLQQVNLLACK